MQRTLQFFQDVCDASPIGMLVTDAGGSIVAANRTLQQLFGYARDELMRQPIELLVDREAGVHSALREGYVRAPQTRPMAPGRDIFGKHRDGHSIPVEIALTSMRAASGDLLVIASIVDLTERRESERLLRETISEKEMLLRELHHRSKNNLQLIASMLDLAAGDDPRNEALRSSRERIESISLLHEQLDQSRTVAALDFTQYARDLVGLVEGSWGRRAPIDVRFEAEPVRLGIDKAVPAGLLLNELLSNAYKHAFPDGRSGTLSVRITNEGDQVRLEVIDDGIGCGTASPAPGHIGLELVRALARQLRGTVQLDPAHGTRAQVQFPKGTP